jgi:AcrR family transcriptional regulator
MATEFTGGGDPRRSLELLWGATEPGRRGPKPKHSVEEVVRAAVTLADAEGLSALSIRRVAEAMGLSAMSLYTYVPSKAELIDLMLDRVWGEIEDPGAAVVGWRARLEFLAHQRWALGERHPWMLQVATHRPPLGPNVLAKIDSAFRAVDGHGLTEIEMDLVVALVSDYVRGAVRAAVEAREVEQQSGITDEQWWSLNEQLLEGRIDPCQFPTLVRVGQACKEAYAGGVNHAQNFEFGLQRVLDGIETFISARTTQTARTA